MNEFIALLIGAFLGFILFGVVVEPSSVEHGRVQVASGEYECTEIYAQWVCGKVDK